MPTEREYLVAELQREDMTYEAYKFLLVKEFLSRNPQWTQNQVESYIDKGDWRSQYDDGYTIEETAKEDMSYWA